MSVPRRAIWQTGNIACFVFCTEKVLKALEEKIVREGKIYAGNVLKVDNFLNHQIDVGFLMQMGEEIARLYSDCAVTKILTIEASGIAIAVAAAVNMRVPVLFAKKSKSKNISDNVYSAKVESFTHGGVFDVVVSREYLSADDRVLIVDDFLANGQALRGLSDIVKSAGAFVVGAAIAIEKGFQKGGDALRAEGMRIESLAVIDSMDERGITFRTPRT